MKNKIVAFAITLLLIVMVLGFVPNNKLDFRLLKQMAAEWAVIAFIVVFFIKNIWLKLFILWSLIRMSMNYNQPSYLAFNDIFYFVVFYQFIVDRFKVKYFKYFLDAICIMAIINAIFVVLQYYGIWIGFVPNVLNCKSKEVIYYWNEIIMVFPKEALPSGYCSGLFSNMNMAASLGAIALPAFFRKKWFWFIPLIGMGLFISEALGGIIPACIALLVFIFIKAKGFRIISLVPILLAVLYIVLFEDFAQLATGNLRFDLWRDVMKIVKVRPIVGWGIGQFRYLFPAIYSFALEGVHGNAKHVFLHNEYLQLLVEQGIVGLTLILGFIGSLVAKGLKCRSGIALIAFIGVLIALINAGGNFLFHTSVGILFVVYAAILTRSDELKEENYV